MLRPQNARICTVAESATELRISPTVVRMLIDIDDLPGVRLGGGRIVVGSSRLDEWMSSKMSETSTLATPKSGHELIATVLGGKHHTVVLYPSVTIRGLWRRAIWQASNEKLVPDGVAPASATPGEMVARWSSGSPQPPTSRRENLLPSSRSRPFSSDRIPWWRPAERS